MNYVDKLRHIQSLDDDTALESILAQAAETSERQTRDRLYAGALVSETTTRYGENTIGQIAMALNIKPPTAYQWKEVVEFYHGLVHALGIIDEMPDVRYTHLRAAMSWGKHIAPDDPEIAADVAYNRLCDAHDNEILHKLADSVALDKRGSEPETVTTSWEADDIRDIDDLGRIHHSARLAYEAGTLVRITVKELKAAPVAKGAAD